ncbi:hypothetical protein [Nostoc sp. KVJ20]|uniref:hypothetical protein n=1 Tax=Nostoc sp. KVJ20 TaxID=457944 RepID=UPI001C40662B|nr:hypothetical protein [Nostoc sp. KVJ20]
MIVKSEIPTVPDWMNRGRTSPLSLMPLLLASPLMLLPLPTIVMLLLIWVCITPVTRTLLLTVMVSSPASWLAWRIA